MPGTLVPFLSGDTQYISRESGELVSPFRFGQQSAVTSPALTGFARFYSNVSSTITLLL